MSDLHGYLPDNLPGGDLLLIGGDIIPLEIQANSNKSWQWWRDTFREWINKQNYDKILFIAGNHDLYLEHHGLKLKEIYPKTGKATYLDNEEFDYISNGEIVKIFGTPYCKVFGNWAFMREPETLEKIFAKIPYNVDILLTHDAPYGTSDIVMQKDVWWANGEHIGNPQLRDAIINAKPKICLHGHLHSTNHFKEMLEDTEVYNVSLKDEKYAVTYLPYTFTL